MQGILESFNQPNHMKTFTKLLSLALLVLPLSVGATSLYGNTDVSVTTTVDPDVTVGAEAGAQGSAGSGAAGANTIVDVEVVADTDATAEANAGSDANMSAEFKAFAATVKSDNERVEDVTVNGDGSVDVAYRHDGKFLGFIPMKVTSHTVVKNNADGTVSVAVKMPWWSFLVTGVSKVKSDIETSLQANAAVKVDAAVAASDETRVKLVNAIISSLNAEAAASATAEADASASAGY